MLRAISLRESWMREIRTSGLTRERAPNGPSLLYSSSSILLGRSENIKDREPLACIARKSERFVSDAGCGSRIPRLRQKFYCFLARNELAAS